MTSDRFHGSSSRAVDDLDDRPAVALVVDRRPPQPVAHAASPLTVGHGETSSTGTPARRRPLDGDVAGVPRRAALLLQRLVVLVDDDDGGEVAGTAPTPRHGRR